jgi:hypothetical protein
MYLSQYLELLKGFLISRSFSDFQSVELHCLGQRPAFADDSNVSGLDVPEAWGQMNGHILVPFLKTVVLLHVMKIVSVGKKYFLRCFSSLVNFLLSILPSDDDGSVHLKLGNNTR